MRLYELTNEFAALADRLVDGEISVGVAASLDALTLGIEEKVAGCVAVYRTFEAEAEGIESEVKRLEAMAKTRRNRAKELKNYLVSCLTTAGIDKVMTPIGKVSVCRAGRPSISWADEDLTTLPDEFVRVKRELDGNKAYSAYREGTLPGGFVVEFAKYPRVS